MDVGVRVIGPPEVRVRGAWVPLRPTKPQTASTPSMTAVSIVRSMKSCFFFLISGS